MTSTDAPAADPGLVRLRVPADPRYARVVRVAVSAFAVRLGLVPAQVEDLRLAVDEALVLLLRDGDAAGPSRSVLVDLRGEDAEALAIGLALDPPGGPGGPGGPADARAEADALARFHELIPAGVAVHEVDATLGRVVLSRPTR